MSNVETVSKAKSRSPHHPTHFPGHTIVAASIAPGTVLYHGHPDNNIPTGPEWLAVDPEHSYHGPYKLFHYHVPSATTARVTDQG